MSSVKYVALLYNPASAKGRAPRYARLARKQLRARGVTVTDFSGSTPEESEKLAADALNLPIDALVVCGGDGLLNLVLQSQAHTDIPIGIIPAGTGNDLARALGIPMDPLDAADLVVDGVPTRTDLAVAEDTTNQKRFFATCATQGFDSLVTACANKIVWPKGSARYLLATAIQFFRFHSLPCHIVLDGKVHLTDRVTLAAVGNTSSYGGGMKICPDADPHDGLLDLTVLGRMNKLSVAIKFPRVFSGRIRGVRGVHQYRATTIRIEIPNMPVFTDGDCYFHSPVTYQIAPRAGYFIVPRSQTSDTQKVAGR